MTSPTTERKRFPLHRRWVVLCVGFLIMASGFALRNAFSVFYPAVVSEFGWSRGNTAIMFSLSIFVYGVLSPVVGGLIDRFRPQLVIGIGIGIMGGSIALCGLATQEWHFYLLYGVIAAVGVSMFGITPLAAVITPWFSKHRALVFAVLAAGFGVSLVAASLVQLLISAYGWQQALTISGLAVAAVMVPLTLVFLRRPPMSATVLPQSVPAAEAEASKGGQDTETSQGWHAREWTLRRALKTPQFWMLWIAGFCQLGLAEKAVIAHEVYFFQDVGYSPIQAASVYSVFGLLFIVGNLVSTFSDKIGREKVYLPACGLAVLGTASLFLISDASQPWMAYMFAVVFGFGMGIMPPVLFASVADFFHGRSYGAIMGMVTFGFSMGGALGPWLAGYMHDVSGSYDSTIIMLLAALLACGLLVWLAAPRKFVPVRG